MSSFLSAALSAWAIRRLEKAQKSGRVSRVETLYLCVCILKLHLQLCRLRLKLLLLRLAGFQCRLGYCRLRFQLAYLAFKHRDMLSQHRRRTVLADPFFYVLEWSHIFRATFARPDERPK